MTLPRTKDQDLAFHSGKKTGAVVGVGVSSAPVPTAYIASKERICTAVDIAAGRAMIDRLPPLQTKYSGVVVAFEALSIDI
jgi:hypothetical protein